jgi:cytochrome c551/c552
VKNLFTRAATANRYRLGTSVFSLILLICAAPSHADPNAVPAPLVDKHCNNCHAMSSILIGPPLIAIASRYSVAEDKERTADVLARKIVAGGGGNWGTVPMVPNEISLEEARLLTRIILQLKPPQ